MTVYESLVTKDKQHSVTPPPPICCEEPCDEPSFWDLLPQCRLNWIAFGLAAIAIGFGLIGLGAINVGNVVSLGNPPINTFYDSTILAQGTRLIAIVLGIIVISTWIFFKACNDDWKIVIIGALTGASAFPLAAIGLIYITVADLTVFPTNFDRTWFNIAISLIVLSIASFLFLAYLTHYSPCRNCIGAKKAVIVSLIFLIGGSAAYSLGRLLWVAVITYQFYKIIPFAHPPFPASAFEAFIFVSIVNILLVVALGWYILDCAVENCFFTFLPLFASVASLGNWALYRVGLNVFAYIVSFPEPLPANTPYIRFAIAIGFVSITALILTFVLVKCDSNAAALIAASAVPLVYAIGTYTYVANAENLTAAGRYVDDILIGIFSGIGITAIIDFFLRCSATCPIPTIIYGLASGSFGWAIIYLYSTYSSNVLKDTNIFHSTDTTTLNTGLNVVLGAAIASILFIRFVACDELLSALSLLNLALVDVGVGGFFGTLAYFNVPILDASDVTASKVIYAIFALAALFLPQFFARCADCKRQIVIAVAALSAGITAVDFGRAVVLGRAVAFDSTVLRHVTFSTSVYIASAAGTAFLGQIIIWVIPESNLYTASLATFMGVIGNGIALQLIIFVNGANTNIVGPIEFGLVGTPWLIFTFTMVVLLLLLQIKSWCIQQGCRFSVGLLIPALTIAVVGRVAGASVALGAFRNFSFSRPEILATFSVNSRMILLSLIIPLIAFFASLKIFCCTTHLAYLPTSIAFIGIIYVASQFELYNPFLVSSFLDAYLPFLNRITQIYFSFDFTTTDPSVISPYVTFITQTYLVYLLFLAPALIVEFVFACSKQISTNVIGTAMAATAVSLGAVGIANVISGVLSAIVLAPGSINVPITNYITFANFLQGIQSQFVLFAVGVLIVWFIYFNYCRYSSC